MDSAYSFDGKVALITGAGSGLGRATAQRFARLGASVLCADIAEDACRATVEAISNAGGNAAAYIGNCADHDTCRTMVDEAVRRFGGLHHAFNNAGVMGSVDDAWDLDEVRRTFAINIEGVYWAMKFEIAHMRAHGGGTIVNTSSIAGISGSVGTIDYTASKHAVVGMTGAAALRYGPEGVRINAICPGLVKTAMTDAAFGDTARSATRIARLAPISGAMADPQDIAEAVTWLSSPASRYVHGVALPIDDGYTA